MREISTKLFTAVGALAIFGAALSAPEAQARPQYLKQFIESYPDLTDAAKMKKCGICHPKNKKMRLDYGKAVGANLGDKNQKDKEKIAGALEKAEETKSEKTGKTFGDLIKDGKLPE